MPLLQSPMQNGSWCGKKIASARFVTWVKALLATGGSGMGHLMTGHSAKATALSWLDKAHVSRDDSAILGHHVVKDDRTMLAYSRDHQAGPERAASSQIAPGQVTTLGMRAPCSHLRSCVCMTPS